MSRVSVSMFLVLTWDRPKQVFKLAARKRHFRCVAPSSRVVCFLLQSSWVGATKQRHTTAQAITHSVNSHNCSKQEQDTTSKVRPCVASTVPPCSHHCSPRVTPLLSGFHPSQHCTHIRQPRLGWTREPQRDLSRRRQRCSLQHVQLAYSSSANNIECANCGGGACHC